MLGEKTTVPKVPFEIKIDYIGFSLQLQSLEYLFN